jgi:hypothetical protein
LFGLYVPLPKLLVLASAVFNSTFALSDKLIWGETVESKAGPREILSIVYRVAELAGGDLILRLSALRVAFGE